MACGIAFGYGTYRAKVLPKPEAEKVGCQSGGHDVQEDVDLVRGRRREGQEGVAQPEIGSPASGIPAKSAGFQPGRSPARRRSATAV